MTKDDLDLTIPAFLRRDPKSQPKRTAPSTDELGRRVIPMPAYDPNNDTWLKPKSMSMEEWNASKQAKTDAKIARLKAIVPKAKRYGALPADFKLRPYRWDTRTGKWVANGEAPAKRESGLILNGKTPKPATKAKAPVDELGVKVASIPLGAEFKKFAIANHVWNDKYDALNPGLQRMNCVNRLRAQVKKGYEIKWPK
jgi:hypothetical protein